MTRIFHIPLMLGAALLALAACQSAGPGGTSDQSAGQGQATPALTEAKQWDCPA